MRKVLDLLTLLENSAAAYVDAMATDVLTGQQALLLMRVPPTGTRIKGLWLGYSGSSLTHSVSRLAELGMIRKSRAAEDRRGILVELTDEGARARDRVIERASRISDMIAAEDLGEVSRTLTHLTKFLGTARLQGRRA